VALSAMIPKPVITAVENLSRSAYDLEVRLVFNQNPNVTEDVNQLTTIFLRDVRLLCDLLLCKEP
jgi:PBP1b-binding outer membrane lipoprotein LpoB